MVLSHCILILLEEMHITVATLGIDCLIVSIPIEDVSCQEHGVEHSQDVSVSYRINKGETFLLLYVLLMYRNM